MSGTGFSAGRGGSPPFYRGEFLIPLVLPGYRSCFAETFPGGLRFLLFTRRHHFSHRDIFFFLVNLLFLIVPREGNSHLFQLFHGLLVERLPLAYQAGLDFIHNDIANHDGEKAITVIKKGEAFGPATLPVITVQNAGRIDKGVPHGNQIAFDGYFDSSSQFIHVFFDPFRAI
ncbi:MAG: hypothetical protein BWX80_04007 [Candidatus Hydrogenedentes bacterium ADurb.Bin101]|nr:MAG: hypothetical protein BWX80_04007 [Candidatus Hydrogenedentes bacterium ADurb.Bin101]